GFRSEREDFQTQTPSQAVNRDGLNISAARFGRSCAFDIPEVGNLQYELRWAAGERNLHDLGIVSICARLRANDINYTLAVGCHSGNIQIIAAADKKIGLRGNDRLLENMKRAVPIRIKDY